MNQKTKEQLMYPIGNFQRAELGPERLPKLKDGFEGVLQVVKTWIKDGRRGHLFMCELVIMSSNHQGCPVGQRVMWKQDLTNKDVCVNAIFQWGAAVLGIDDKNEPGLNWLRQNMQGLIDHAVLNQEYNSFTHDMSTNAPRYVTCRVYDTTTKNNRQFTAHSFSPFVAAAG